MSVPILEAPDDCRLDLRYPVAWESMRVTASLGWQRGLLAGFNGNLSQRLDDPPQSCLVTRSGAAKGSLQADDLCLVDIDSGSRLAGGNPSSELAMHLAIYRCQPRAKAILHTHPPHLLALGLRMDADKRLCMAVHEAAPLREDLAFCPEEAPGTAQLAENAGLAACGARAIWLECHGLAVWAETLGEALARSEEMDHLARIQLLSLRGSL